MTSIMYKIAYGLVYAVSLLPYKVLYAISDCMYVLVYHIVRYRRKTVRNNLASSFPEKDKRELRDIERGFYHFLCDYVAETMKLLSISRDEMLRHIEFRNTDEVERCFDQGQTCSALLGHYCNWEYLSTTGLSMKRHPDAIMGLIYHPIKNDVIDRVFIDIRQHLGGVCIPKNEVLRRLITYKREHRMTLFGYISDQAPKWQNMHLWLDFLGHDTPVFNGGERIMRKMNEAVFYVEMQRPCRGKYTVNFKLMTRDPASLDENELTRRFFAMLEETIRREPRYYLWSHKRWKRTREEFDRRFKVEGGKILKRDQD